MLYEIRYTASQERADQFGEHADFERHIEAPAHRRGILPAVLLADAITYGMMNGAESFTVHEWTPPRIMRDGAKLGESSGQITRRPIPCSQAHADRVTKALQP